MTEKKKETCKVSIYIGPTVPGLQSQHIFGCSAANAVKDPEVKLVLKDYPGVKKLIVNMDALDVARSELARQGSAMYNAYHLI